MNEQVWKTTKTEYYTRLNKTVSSYTGSIQHACTRKVTYWSARINGKVVSGFATKKSAVAALAEAVA